MALRAKCGGSSPFDFAQGRNDNSFSYSQDAKSWRSRSDRVSDPVFGELDEFGVGWVEVGVGCGGDAGEAFEESVGGGVEELVGDAEDPAVADGFEGLPVSLGDDAVEGDAIPCSAPGEEEDVGVGGCDVFGGGVGAGCTEVAAAGGFD